MGVRRFIVYVRRPRSLARPWPGSITAVRGACRPAGTSDQSPQTWTQTCRQLRRLLSAPSLCR